MADHPLDALLPGKRCDDVTAHYFGRELGRGVVLRLVPPSDDLSWTNAAHAVALVCIHLGLVDRAETA